MFSVGIETEHWHEIYQSKYIRNILLIEIYITV